MGLDSVGSEIYDIHGYFLRLTVGQWTPRFWGVTNPITADGYLGNCNSVISLAFIDEELILYMNQSLSSIEHLS